MAARDGLSSARWAETYGNCSDGVIAKFEAAFRAGRHSRKPFVPPPPPPRPQSETT